MRLMIMHGCHIVASNFANSNKVCLGTWYGVNSPTLTMSNSHVLHHRRNFMLTPFRLHYCQNCMLNLYRSDHCQNPMLNSRRLRYCQNPMLNPCRLRHCQNVKSQYVASLSKSFGLDKKSRIAYR